MSWWDKFSARAIGTVDGLPSGELKKEGGVLVDEGDGEEGRSDGDWDLELAAGEGDARGEGITKTAC